MRRVVEGPYKQPIILVRGGTLPTIYLPINLKPILSPKGEEEEIHFGIGVVQEEEKNLENTENLEKIKLLN